jgi:hypothetical protein
MENPVQEEKRMTYQEVLKQANGKMGPYCRACPVCNGKACRNTIPGPGAKGYGDTAMRNFDEWKKIRVNMDTLTENCTPDTSFDFFGYKMKYPIFAGPVGAVNLHYGEKLNDVSYNQILVSGCAAAGTDRRSGASFKTRLSGLWRRLGRPLRRI